MQKEFDFLGIYGSEKLHERGIVPVCFAEVDSTNAAARRYVFDGKDTPALFAADTQSAGRGRLGRSFFSPSETGIYMTLLLDITGDAPTSVIALTSAAAVVVTRELQRYSASKCEIKWVNDIYMNGRKVCGILAESFSHEGRGYVILGVGVNLATEDFPVELRGVAGSLGAKADTDMRRRLTEALAVGLFDIYGCLKNGDFSYMEEYRAYSLVLGKEVRFTQNGEWYEGVAQGITDMGALTVKLLDGQVHMLNSGEISLRLN